MRRISLLSILVSFAIARVAPAAEKKLAFNRDIRPILSENCFECHGFDAKARQADLRLDQADSAYAKKEDGAIPIVPGHPEMSELWRRITSTDESEMMPPPDSHHKLKPAQKEILRRWIEQGAPFQKHWAFIPPVKAELPHVSDQSWPRDEIDNFILARIDAAGLKHAPEADRRTLIRRVSLDLTGLPPSANDVEDFAHNDDPHTYEKLVDRLLASPHYGERMALVWLDAARYADTNGFSIDGGRHMWLWRDWVINAFNTNMPYDEFLREQLAGDLLSHRTEAQLVATGFERNNMNTHEGGTIPEENLTNYNVDRVKTLGEAVLGLTLGCAQCHDHKFDPITQRDFYRLYAYFNTLSDVGLDGDRGINSRPSIRAHTVLHTGEEPTLRRQIADLKRKLANPSPADVAQWERKQREQLNRRGTNFQLLPVNLLKVSTPNIGKGYGIDPPNFVHVNIPSGLLAYDVSMRLPKTDKPITGLRIIFHPNAQGARGFGTLPRRGLSPFAESSEQMGTGTARRVVPLSDALAKPTFVLTSFSASAESVPGDQVNLNRLRDVRHVTADSWLENYRPENVLDTRNFNGWSPDPTTTGPVRITVTFAQPIDAADTPFLTAKLNFGYGDNLIPTRFEILATTGTDNDSDLPPKIINILEQQARASSPPTVATDRPARTNQVAPRASQLVTLNAYFAAHADATRRDRIALANLEERLAVLTKKFPTMVMDVSSHPRETHILRRGDYSQPMEKVSPGTPAVLPPLPPGAPDSRLALANWVTMRGNPLTARVEVNRLWQIFFGTGIVATPADFGAQGAYPTHPELLDWLAVDFMDHNWDIKRLAKKIVMSATYRQASARRLSPFAESRGLSPFSESSEQKGTVP
ncbi:MAG TPA: PSD1 and planctomycete cytochrome C domain-containing protein, partial [Lacipirellulaceae bacterium]|nr:PSD1 and planctomycete cytochrome C domain-containing protein [Lacipirellulaceae bacterium]